MKISLIKPNSLVDCEVTEFVTAKELSTLITSNSWAPGVFADNYRKKVNFRETELLVFDIDSGCTLSEAIEYFKPYPHIIATTRSHQIEKNGIVCDRFRVILPLSHVITDSATYSATWHHYAARYNFVDPACKDEGRFYYPSVEIISVNNFGEPVQVIAAAPAVRTARPELSSTDLTTRGKLSKATKDFLLDGVVPGKWNASLFKAAKDHFEQGYELEETLERFKTMSNPYFTGTLDAVDLATIESAYKVEPKYSPRLNFPAMILNKQAGTLSVKYNDIRNVEYLITEVAGWKLRFNELKGQALVTLPGEEEVPFHDDHIVAMRYYHDEYDLRASDKNLFGAFLTAAKRNSFHPAKDFIEKEVWDGADHIGALFNTLTLEEGELEESVEMYQRLFRKWFISVVAKIYRPGRGSDLMLVLKGEQGSGKSTWLKNLNLGPGTLLESHISPEDKDHKINHLHYNIWLSDEFDASTRKADVSLLKSFLSLELISARKPYDRIVSEGLSQCSFCGSVNSEKLLYDQTGNRRFLVLPVESFVWNHGVNMHQVYAQCKHLFEQGESYTLNREESRQLSNVNEEYVAQDWMWSAVRKMRAGEDRVTVAELLQLLGVERPEARDTSAMGARLKQRGFQKIRCTDEETRQRAYFYLIDRASVVEALTFHQIRD